MTNDPIFIVGILRSGTTLLAAMLGSHSRIDCGPETHFFRYLAMFSEKNLVSRKSWPIEAVDFISSLKLNGEKVHKHFGLSISQIELFLKYQNPSVATMLESLTQLHAKQAGKSRWVEKTPNHMLHLCAIRKHYPLSPIIRIIRDPRDAALSITKLPWASKSALANLFLCDEWNRKSVAFFDDDFNSFNH